MKVVHLNSFELKGGAAKAARRLHHGLVEAAVTSRMLVQFKESDDWRIQGPVTKAEKAAALIKDALDPLPKAIYPRGREKVWSINWTPASVARRIGTLGADLVHLHWINAGFVSVESIGRIARPVVWTLHDMWPLTGGCHYDKGCQRFLEGCGRCPQLCSSSRHDLSRLGFRRKQGAWRNIQLTLVAPSRWLAGEAGKSPLFQDRDIRVIANGLDLDVYKPRERAQARELLGLPGDRPLVLFCAAGDFLDPRKGGELIRKILAPLAAWPGDKRPLLAVMGSSEPQAAYPCPLEMLYLGRMHDDIAIALAYAAADVFLAPSFQDNLPNTVMEALACGTPVAAFRVGGIPEMIDHGVNGYLAACGDEAGLGAGVAWLLNHPEPARLAEAARKTAEQCYDIKRQAQCYIELYEELVR
ncbi:MAG TPA: glycosyltransferase [Sedimenticola sp.]|nr:glycosyltransferase [Sedimenticola sp.]